MLCVHFLSALKGCLLLIDDLTLPFEILFWANPFFVDFFDFICRLLLYLKLFWTIQALPVTCDWVSSSDFILNYTGFTSDLWLGFFIWLSSWEINKNLIFCSLTLFLILIFGGGLRDPLYSFEISPLFLVFLICPVDYVYRLDMQ